jgi:hypothetical protein
MELEVIAEGMIHYGPECAVMRVQAGLQVSDPFRASGGWIKYRSNRSDGSSVRMDDNDNVVGGTPRAPSKSKKKAPAWGSGASHSTRLLVESFTHRLSDDLPKRTTAKGWLVGGAFR